MSGGLGPGRSEFADAQGASIDTLLNLLYVLLLFSVIVAVLGIISTLALSVFERTREIGLLRAVGLRRRQPSGMITIESIATAVFGAVLGTMVGLGLGVALQRGLESQGLRILSIPWTADSGHADRLGRGRRPRRHPPRDPRGPPRPPAGDRQWPVGTASPGIPLGQSRLDPINLLGSRLWSHLDLCHAHDLDAPVLVAAC